MIKYVIVRCYKFSNKSRIIIKHPFSNSHLFDSSILIAPKSSKDPRD